MPVKNSSRWSCFTSALAVGLCLLFPAGCKKSELAVVAVTVAISPADLNADGTLNDKGIAKLDAKSGEPALSIIFYRAPLADAGLLQLAKFKNLQRIEAVGSSVTEAGINKLKESLPSVEVAH